MPSKTEEYLALAQRTANGLTRYWESWTDYLTTASRMYKYPFADQLMIYAPVSYTHLSGAPFGYQKDPADHNHLVIDPNTAPVVEYLSLIHI